MWLRYRNRDGYGIGTWNGKRQGAHRIAYEAFVSPIPEGSEIDHLCRNRACVRPDHLEAVAHLVNVRRGEAPSAAHSRKTHCVHGHPFDETNTVYRDTPSGRRWRKCRTCRDDANRRAARSRATMSRPEYLEAMRLRTHCKHDHELTPENTVIVNGSRSCLTCRREGDRLRQRARRASRRA